MSGFLCDGQKSRFMQALLFRLFDCLAELLDGDYLWRIQ
jgi:hypothetical protein